MGKSKPTNSLNCPNFVCMQDSWNFRQKKNCWNFRFCFPYRPI